MSKIAPSSVIPMIPERIIITVLRLLAAVLRIAVCLSSSIVCGKFGAIVRRNERLIESTPVSTRRRPLGRGEALVVSAGIRLLWIRPERVLILRADDVGHAGWVQKLFVVTENDKEEEGRETEFDEERNNAGPSAPVPGSLTPYTRRGVSIEKWCSFSPRDPHIAASSASSVVLVTGPHSPQLYNTG